MAKKKKVVATLSTRMILGAWSLCLVGVDHAEPAICMNNCDLKTISPSTFKALDKIALFSFSRLPWRAGLKGAEGAKGTSSASQASDITEDIGLSGT